MPIYLGNNEVIEYSNGASVDAQMPYDYGFPAQYWNVRPCGASSPITQLAIHTAPGAISVGSAVRPVIAPFSTIPLPGYESPVCYELISPATTGIDCGIRAPAINCAQSVCL